jgi:hypothetical protein
MGARDDSVAPPAAMSAAGEGEGAIAGGGAMFAAADAPHAFVIKNAGISASR